MKNMLKNKGLNIFLIHNKYLIRDYFNKFLFYVE